MKFAPGLLLSLLLPTAGAGAASFQTFQGSMLSFPAAAAAPQVATGSGSLAGSNLMLSAVAPATANGGHVSLKNAVQWTQRYNGGNSAVYASVVRPDGSLAVTGPADGPYGGYDFATVCYRSDGSPLWTNLYDGLEHGSDTPRFIASDTNGNVWIAGESMRYSTNSTLTDVVAIKYSSNGVPLWTNRYNSFETNGAYATGLLVDNSGNGYVEFSAAFWTGYTGTPVEDGLIKYDPEGNVLWAKHFFAYAPDSGEGLHDIGPIALDPTGNLLLGGTVGSQHYATGYAVVKHDPLGNPIWTNLLPWGVESLTTDREGNVIITGEFWGATYSRMCVIVKCSSAGTLQWTNVVTGPNYDGGNVPRSMVDTSGNTIVILGKAGAASGLYQLVKFSSAGVPLWTNDNINFACTNGMIYGSALDSAGNLYLTGRGFAVGSSYSDYVTIKCSPAAKPLWTNRFDGPVGLNDIPFALAVEGAGSVYVSGGVYTYVGRREFCTVKYGDLVFYSPPSGFTGIDQIASTVTDEFGDSAAGTLDVSVVPGAFGLHISSIPANPSGAQIAVSGMPGTNSVIVERSTDLLNWQPILTNAPVNGSLEFLDSSGAFAQRFYRAFQAQ